MVLSGSFFVLRHTWNAYAAVEPQKAYSLSMLFVRLLIFSTTIAATSVVAAIVSRDRRTPWVAGIIMLAVSIPDHLYPGYVWHDYPAWYHTAYLLSVLPLAVTVGRFASRLAASTARFN